MVRTPRHSISCLHGDFFLLNEKKKKRQIKNEKTFSTLIALSVALFTGLIASFRHFMRGIQGGLSLVHQHAIGFFFYLI